MNLIITLSVLCLMAAVFYAKTYELVLSPALLFMLAFILGIAICIINPDWEFDIGPQTALCIIAANLSFVMGHLTVKYTRLGRLSFRAGRLRSSSFQKYVYDERPAVFWGVVLLQCIFIYLNGRFLFQIGGNLKQDLFVTARAWLTDENHTTGNAYWHRMFISETIAMLYVYLFLYQLKYKKKRHFKYFIPILQYMILQILTTSRSGIIFFLGYCMVISVSMITKQGTVRSDKKKIIVSAVKYFAVVVAAFLGLGFFTGKIAKVGIWNMFAIYFGASVYALDYFVVRIAQFASPAWGYNCFPIIKSIQLHLGIQVPAQERYYFPFVRIPSKTSPGLFSSTNLFTSIVNPLCDFGWGGMLVFFFLLGMLYAVIFFYIKNGIQNSGRIGPAVIFLGYIMMPVFDAGAAYAFGDYLFSPQTVYRIMYFIILMKLLFKRDVNGNSSMGYLNC